MCGIIGIIAKQPFSVRNTLLASLKRLEYRGYDSVGYATKEGDVMKDKGYVDAFMNSINPSIKTTLAISHTRWATHGGVTQTNAHPHVNESKTIFVVHNGIIENYKELRSLLEEHGCHFKTQTDSEVVPHYFEHELKLGHDMKTAMLNFMRDAKGAFAILMFQKNEQTLYAMKRESPLALGIVKDMFILGSDIYAFSNQTNKAIFFEDNECAVITDKTYTLYDNNGKEIVRKPTEFTWTQTDETKEQYDHYMMKEIHEEPLVAERLIKSFATVQKEKIAQCAKLIKEHKKIIFLASGTSYHASLMGSILLNKLGYDATATIASEAETFVRFNEKTLVIAISQSGETMDVIIPLKKAKEAGSTIVSIVNVPFSTIQRMSVLSLEVLAGQEVCVAATKTFIGQVLTLLEIAKILGYPLDLSAATERIKETITENEPGAQTVAAKLTKHQNMFVLGRGLCYPMACEIALKLKEIAYVHGEGMMGGELKHGTIALIEKGTPVIALIPHGDEEMQSNAKEVEARGADVIVITDDKKAKDAFTVPLCSPAEFALHACTVGYLLSYFIAKLRGNDIDKPKNLAKSVTVK